MRVIFMAATGEARKQMAENITIATKNLLITQAPAFSGPIARRFLAYSKFTFTPTIQVKIAGLIKLTRCRTTFNEQQPCQVYNVLIL
jgi:hypothetical protein